MAVSPTVRAAVIRWVTEWYETHILYQYSGEPENNSIPQLELVNLPDGYVETDRIEMPDSISVVYQNADKTYLF